MRRVCVTIRGAEWRDLKVLATQSAFLDSIRIYDVEELTSYFPLCGEIPWQVAWLASRYHRKHRLTLCKMPSMHAF